MQIERNYHQRAVAFMNEIKREEEERKSGMSEEEKAAENAQMESEVHSIIQSCNEQRSRKYRIVEPGKLSTFQKIAEHALWLAERAEMDIRVTMENLHGKISFATDYFLLNHSTPRKSIIKMKICIWNAAILTADLYIGGLFVLYIFLGVMFITNVKVPFIGQKCK